MRRTRNYILIKLLRTGGWCLLVVVTAFLVSGWMMTGRFHFGRLLSAQEAKDLHRLLHWPLVVLVVAHAGPATYFALIRWRKRRQRR